ncbi:MAG: replicative DNA helicase [Candidatus Aenigmarchaeota archaeon]|nr:replicative DNA helicase [Candidatus Aenigmarchaeota archaeon]
MKINKTEIGKLPPQNIDAEQSVLGCLLIDKEAIIKIADILKSGDFYKSTHQIIFSIMLELFEQQEPIDILSLSNRLAEKKKLKKIGGRSYLASLANSVPTSTNILSYAKIVQRKSTLRKLIQTSSDVSELAYQEGEDTSNILDQAEQKLFAISQRYLRQNFVAIQDLLPEAYERIEKLHKQKGLLRGLSTGFIDLDNVLAGLQNANLIILAARPSMGKSSLALDIARNIAIGQKVPVGIFSLEMSKEEIIDRFLCAQSNLNLWKMRTGNLSTAKDSNDFSKLNEAINDLSEAKVFIDDSPIANIMEVRSKARRLQMEHQVGFIVLDYLQLMEANRESRVQEISEISRGLKSIARELNIPILALSQLSRAVESRTPSIPKLSDLRESGALEQDADVVLFIYREDMYRKDSNKPNIADLIVAKHRNGPAGMTINLYFDKTIASFKNLQK